MPGEPAQRPGTRRAPLHWLPTIDNPRSSWGRLLKRGCDRVNLLMQNWRAQWLRRCVFHSTFFSRITNRVPQVATAYDLNHELLPEKYSDSWGLAFQARVRDYMQRATRLIAISRKTKTDLVRFYGIDPARVDVVHLAVDPKDFWPDQSPEHQAQLQASFGLVRPYLLYVGGRAYHYKNFDRLLEAFAVVARTTPLTLAVAGIPFSAEEQATIRALGLETRVRSIVNPPVATLRVLYSLAQAFVFPSLHEGFGLPLLEAMACGTPVLASDTAVFREVAGDAFVPFDPADPTAIAAALVRTLAEEVRQKLIASGWQRVRQFSWDRCAEETVLVYRKALAARTNSIT